MSILTSQQFRADFSEFSSTTIYPNAMVNFYINLSAGMLNVNRFLDQYIYAQELFTAHCITIEAKSLKEASTNGIPGTMSAGIPSSKTVDKVAITYDIATIMDPNAGHWNMSTYGIRLWQMMRIFGAGPIYVGAGAAPVLSGPAYVGPDCSPSQIGFGN